MTALMMRARALGVISACAISAAPIAACGDDGKLPLGAVCGDDTACASGLCYDQVCLDPEADPDGDQLTNRIESGLGTDLMNPDSDADGVGDRAELDAAFANLDSDGDDKVDALESAIADADRDCVVDQADPNDTDPGEGASHPAVATVCPTLGVCGADGAVLAVACPNGTDQPSCDFEGVPGFGERDDDCDGTDDDCDGRADEDGTCTAEAVRPIFCEGLGDEDGRFEVDPDGAGPAGALTVACHFAVGGDWVRLDRGVEAAITASGWTGPRQYLYTAGTAWYRSPITRQAWSWDAPEGGASIDGVWTYYASEFDFAGDFDCDGFETPPFGLDCTSFTESGFWIRAEPAPVPDEGQVTLDESGFPRALGFEGPSLATVWVRFIDCAPDAGQMLGDASFLGLSEGGACWYAGSPTKAGEHVSFDADVPSDGQAPSLRADNPATGNGLDAVQAYQGGLTVLPNHTYVASVWARAATPRTIGMHAVSSRGDVMLQRALDVGTAWAPHTAWFVAEGSDYDSRFELLFGDVSTAAVWVDKASLVDLGSNVCEPTDTFGDGGFDHGALICWNPVTTVGNPTVASFDADVRAGGSAPSLKLSGAGTPVVADIGLIQSARTLFNGYDMRIHVWARAAAPVPLQWVVWSNDKELARGTVTLTTSWAEYALDFATGAGAAGEGASTYGFFTGNAAGHAVWLDDLFVELVGRTVVIQ